MTTTIVSTIFTKEVLFADLEKDGITVDANTIIKAKDGLAYYIYCIGWEYYKEKKKYDKAMAWYRLAAVKNNSWAQNNIGILYDNGLGVPTDYLLAMDWYLKAAVQNNELALENIGRYFEEGHGISMNKYKALEWYHKISVDISGKKTEFNRLSKQGIKLAPEDEDKPFDQLIKETEDIVWPDGRTIEEKQLKQEINRLKQLKNKVEKESSIKNNKIASLEEEIQTLRVALEHKQHELDAKQESIEEYKRKEQTINRKLQALKEENHALSLKIETEKSLVKSLQNENKMLQTASENTPQGTTKRVGELERLNHSLERILEQERQLKDNQIEVIKGKMEILLEKETQRRIELENKFKVVTKELESVKISIHKDNSLRKNYIKNEIDNGSDINDSSSNETDYDTEYDSITSDNNDINYDTPSEGENDDDNNDLNYDSDGHTKNRKNTPLN